jgi:hypothetical protein
VLSFPIFDDISKIAFSYGYASILRLFITNLFYFFTKGTLLPDLLIGDPIMWCLSEPKIIFTALATYWVRAKAWAVLQRMAMGLEGYPFELPQVERNPSNGVNNAIIKYEDMPKDAEHRALNNRNTWISRHLGDVSETFSNMIVAASDITSLLRDVEADESLVHGAYYTDDECIARIADWISGRG